MPAVPPVPGCAVILNVVAVPTWALAEVVIDAVGSGSTVTVTVADGADVVVVAVPVVEEDPTPAVAVTLAVLVVVSVALARPVASVGTTEGLTEPLSVLNVTGTFVMRFPPTSLTVAVSADRPPLETVDGRAVNAMPATPAAPTKILTAPALPVFTPPERAATVAVPDSVPALNVTITRPPESVSAASGSIVPSEVVNVTSVPACAGVPAALMTCAMRFVDPLKGTVVASAVSVMVEPAGARSGTR
jgi:hypothetical protein